MKCPWRPEKRPFLWVSPCFFTVFCHDILDLLLLLLRHAIEFGSKLGNFCLYSFYFFTGKKGAHGIFIADLLEIRTATNIENEQFSRKENNIWMTAQTHLRSHHSSKLLCGLKRNAPFVNLEHKAKNVMIFEDVILPILNFGAFFLRIKNIFCTFFCPNFPIWVKRGSKMDKKQKKNNLCCNGTFFFATFEFWRVFSATQKYTFFGLRIVLCVVFSSYMSLNLS